MTLPPLRALTSRPVASQVASQSEHDARASGCREWVWPNATTRSRVVLTVLCGARVSRPRTAGDQRSPAVSGRPAVQPSGGVGTPAPSAGRQTARLALVRTQGSCQPAWVYVLLTLPPLRALTSMAVASQQVGRAIARLTPRGTMSPEFRRSFRYRSRTVRLTIRSDV